MSKKYIPINFNEKFALFFETWSPKVIGELNDYQFKLAKLKGEFVWHKHKNTDEAFIILDGQLTIKFRDGKVILSAGEMYVVPKGVEHKPVAENECQVIIVEPKGIINTGNAKSKLTARDNVWI